MAQTKPTILVTDDSLTPISMYELSTEALDVRPEAFRSPLDSLLYVAENDASLIFLDITMRGMDGLTVLKKIREIEQHADTAVIVVTSKDYA